MYEVCKSAVPVGLQLFWPRRASGWRHMGERSRMGFGLVCFIASLAAVCRALRDGLLLYASCRAKLWFERPESVRAR